jgi:drug/metabolite transporter (DMT)-like permease
MQINRAMTGFEWLLLLALSVLWGGSFFFNHLAVAEVPPLTLVSLRVGLAALILHALLRVRGLKLPADAGSWRRFAAMGLLNNALPFALIVWGQTQIASGLASILNATTPLAGVVVAHVFTTDEKIGAGRLAGVLAGIAGVAVLIGPEALHGFGTKLLPELACLAAAISYAFAGVYGRRFRGLPAMATATGQVTASTAMLLPLALLADKPWLLPAPHLPAVAAIAGLAVLSTALAYALYFRLLSSAGATNILLVTFLIPVSAILLGALVLGENLSANHIAGLALIGMGLAAIDGRIFPLFCRAKAPQ